MFSIPVYHVVIFLAMTVTGSLIFHNSKSDNKVAKVVGVSLAVLAGVAGVAEVLIQVWAAHQW